MTEAWTDMRTMWMICALSALAAIASPVRSMVGAKHINAAQTAWTNPYVTDGLVAMWDGEWNAGGGVHDATATVWKDLAGSSDLAITGTWGTNCLVGQGSCTTDVYKDACNAHSMTIEVLAKIPNTAPKDLFRADGGNAWYSADGIPYKWLRLHNGLCNTTGLLPSAGDSFNASVVLGDNNYRRLWINNVDSVSFTYTPSTPVSTDYFQVGGYEQIVKCFRIYSRALTAEEIAANYAIDKARFNLP